MPSMPPLPPHVPMPHTKDQQDAEVANRKRDFEMPSGGGWLRRLLRRS
ncbi:MAG: hypothetical protein JWO22_1782 [Frankiales bacterium]|nr:hypothetical protein [Frankiales bacterium]